VQASQAMVVGDPLDERVDVGPMIDQAAAHKTQQSIEKAAAAGATLLTGGTAEGPFLEPTVLTGVPDASPVCQEELFAPVIAISPFDDFKEAVARTNNSAYGLQAGLFTDSLENALYAFDNLEVGGVILNDVPTYRTDPMPYGGVKDSGQGREGPRYAIEEMTELRLMVLNRF